MKTNIRSPRRLAAALAAAFALTAAACSDGAGPDDHADVEVIRLTIGGTQVIEIEGNSQTATLVAGVPTTVTAEFLDHDGDVVDVHDDDFELRVTPSAGITFTRTGAFSGTLTGAAAGTVNVAFSLFHLEGGHADLGPYTVAVTITP